MAQANRIPGFGGGDDIDAVWKMQNVADFQRWISDNKKKVDEGGAVVQSVVSIGTEVASAACVKWFREKGWEQGAVADLTSEIADRVLAKCGEGKDGVLRDCAMIFTGTGNTMLVMMMAFVSYSVIGVQIAESLMEESEG